MKFWKSTDKISPRMWKSILICTLIFFLFGSLPVMSVHSEVEVPSRTEILLVSNGVYPQEQALEAYIEDFSAYNLAILKDNEVNETTDYSPYDILILTEFTSAFSPEEFQRIQDSGVPILVVEQSSFHLAHQFELLTSESAAEETATKVQSALPGINDLTWILGVEPEIYRSPSSLYTVASETLADHVVPIMLSPSGQPVVFFACEHEILVSGISEFHQNNVDGWFLFDLLLRQLHPSGPDYKNHQEVIDSLRISGLADYLDRLNRPQNQPPAAQIRMRLWDIVVEYNLFEFIPYIQRRVRDSDLAFAIFEGQVFAYNTEAPLPHHFRCGHSPDKSYSGDEYSPDRWLAGQSWWGDESADDFEYPLSCRGYYYPDCPTCNTKFSGIGEPVTWNLCFGLCWDSATQEEYAHDLEDFLEYMDFTTGSVDLRYNHINSYIVRGVDMGANINYYGITHFYFGDTWGWRASCDDCESPNTFRNDAMAVTTDLDPRDGVDLTFVLGLREEANAPSQEVGFYGVNIPGVHQEVDDKWMADFWNWKSEIAYTVPYGAVFIPGKEESDTSQQWPPMVLVSYVTASNAGRVTWADVNYERFTSFAFDSDSHCDDSAQSCVLYTNGDAWDECRTKTLDCDIPHERKNPLAWMGCSLDGLLFRNCYADDNFPDKNPPFSFDEIEYLEDCCTAEYREYDWTKKSKFNLTTPVYISADDIAMICGNDQGNPLCDFGGTSQSGVVLLYGNGRPVVRSPLYLAFIEEEDLRNGKRLYAIQAPHVSGRPRIRYYIQDGGQDSWSYFEEDASPLPTSYWNTKDNPCHEPELMYEGLGTWTEWIKVILEAEGYFAGELPENPENPDDWEAQNNFEMALNEAISDRYTTAFYGENIWEQANAYWWANTMMLYKFYRRYDTCSKQMDIKHGLSEPAFHFSPETCLPSIEDQTQMFRPLSAIIVREPENQPPRILLLGMEYLSLYSRQKTTYKWAWLSSPWDIHDGGELNEPIRIPGEGDWLNDIEGYGTYIINGSGNEYLRNDAEKGILSFWITVSTWGGPGSIMPYGAFTKEIKIKWPPPDLETKEGSTTKR